MAALDRFFSLYAGVNAFTQLVGARPYAADARRSQRRSGGSLPSRLRRALRIQGEPAAECRERSFLGPRSNRRVRKADLEG
jgi:hypothetical protein